MPLSLRGPGIFFRVRVTVLLLVLAVVLLFAWRDVRRRHGRTSWDRPLAIAIVLVRRTPLDPAAIAAFEDRVAVLDARLAEERRRYRPGALRPFMLAFVGPVDDADPPPKPAGETLLDAAKQAWRRWRWTSAVDSLAGLDGSQYDSRIYVSACAPEDASRERVEGESEEGGRLGTVEVELDPSMVDFALFVAAHELFHTLGASDKYDAAGRTLVPSGFAEPDRTPPLPQEFVEIMAENRPIGPSLEVPPDSLVELAVGPTTAAEIGWTK
jgi:hypothetical protein